MTDNNSNYEGVEDCDLASYVEEAYLNYALYVIKDRGLPFIGDGLKPVQRRIIYTMSIEGIDSSAKKKKSAYVVGQVLGRFHPHGDSACYEAMVLMTQDFSFRYPLIEGQGNFGDIFVPDGFAAMRYTEAFLSPIGKFLTQELHQGGTKYRLNYTGDEKEPEYLPARIPHILLNGISGIAVGMATDIPPHNIEEVINATIALLDNPKLTVEDLVPHYIKGPDYPTGAEIINSNQELIDLYTNGTGRIRMRATWRSVHNRIEITSLLPHTAGELIQNIATLIQNKKLPQVEDIRDESSQKQTLIALILKGKNTDPEAIMNFLFANTDLERSYTANLNIIGLNGKPEVKSLTTILGEWIIFRKDIVTLRYQHRQVNLLARLNRVKGYLIAFNNLDKVIEIVRFASQAKEELINQLNLNDEQAEAILELKVRNLAKLEEDKLIAEEQALVTENESIMAILNSEKLLIKQIKAELKADVKNFTQLRLTQIVERQAISNKQLTKAMTADLIAEDVTVIISEAGYIRCAKGHNINLDNLAYRTGDKYLTHVQGKSTQNLILLDSTGRSYTLDVASLPSARGYGEPVSSKINLEDKAQILYILFNSNQGQVILSSSIGYGFICQIDDLESRNKNGKAVVNLDGGNLLPPLMIEDPELDQILAISNLGRVLIFPLHDLPKLSKGKGNKIIDLNGQPNASMQYLSLIKESQKLRMEHGKRVLKIDNLTLFAAKSTRGRKGQQLIRGLNKNSIIIVE